MISSNRMHSVLIHRYSASFQPDPIEHARSGPRSISRMSQESRELHLGLMTGSILEETLNRHLYEDLEARRARDKFEAVEDAYSTVDEQVRARLWSGLFGNAPMPHIEDHVVENYMGSLDKYLRKERKMNEEEMHSIFKRMRGKR